MKTLKEIAREITDRKIASKAVRGLVIIDVLRQAGFSTIQIATERLDAVVTQMIEDNETSEKIYKKSLI